MSGESSPPRIMILGISSLALPTSAEIAAPKPAVSIGKSKSGTSREEISVRRSRSASFSSLRYTTPMFLQDMSGRSLAGIERRNHLDQNLFEVLFLVLRAQRRKRPFRQKLAGLDNSDHIAKFFYLAHHMRGKNHRLPAFAAFADELDTRSGR